MKKSLCLIILLFLCLIPSFIYATSINMNLPNNTFDSNNTNNTIDENVNSNTNINSANTNTNTSLPYVSQTSNNSNNEDFFTPENILNIILIAIGIVLVLLGIAIYIRK